MFSLFYLPDPSFAKMYGEWTLKNHEEFTVMDFDGMSPNYRYTQNN